MDDSDLVPMGTAELYGAMEVSVEARTFLCWILAGTLHDGHEPATLFGELANRWPAFLEHRRKIQTTADIGSDFQAWIDESQLGFPHSVWMEASRHSAADARLCRAHEWAHDTSRTLASPQRYATYEEWKRFVWTSEETTPSQPLPAIPMPVLLEGHLRCGSNATIQGLREVIANNSFGPVQDSPWPTARLERGDSKGLVELRPVILDEQPLIPPEELETWQLDMWRQREELSDLDVDTLDALNAMWLEQAQSQSHGAVATVDSILEMRGLQPKKGGRGNRGGYEKEQRLETMRTLGRLQSVWVTMNAVHTYEVTPGGRRKKATRVMQSRAFVITDRAGQLRFDGYVDVDVFMFRPGDVLAHVLFGPGRQTALMSAMALRFNPYTQAWEKRLTRYLSWQWRCRARQENYEQPFRVATLLAAVGDPAGIVRPTRTRERLEKALDILVDHKVISGWQYHRWNEDEATRKGWFTRWQQATLLITPPDLIREHYKSLERRVHKSMVTRSEVGEELEHKRKELSISQAEAASNLGISQSYWSRLVKGKRDLASLNPAVRARIEAWLKGDL
jgi:predicted XRE-type DNA-binding protein